MENLSKVYTKPKEKLGFASIQILNSGQDDFSYLEYTFIDDSGKKVKITLREIKLKNIKIVNSYLSIELLFLTSSFKVLVSLIKNTLPLKLNALLSPICYI